MDNEVNNDVNNEVDNKSDIESALISALNKLQYAELNQTLLGNLNSPQPELATEAHFAFTIADQNFVMNAKCFCEVFVNLPIAPLPNAPNLLLGLCNIRSTLVPVYQIYTLLEGQLPAKKIVFCIGKGEQSVALLINDLPQSIALGQQHLVASSTAESSLASLTIAGHYSYQKKQYQLLDGATLGEQLLQLSARESASASANILQEQIKSQKTINSQKPIICQKPMSGT